MIRIVGGKLSQWDVGRRVSVSCDATHVHFANKGDSEAVIMETANGEAKIPDYLLRTGKALLAYAVLGGVTVGSKAFAVRTREKPENYIYEDDQRNYIYELIQAVEEAIAEAESVADTTNHAKEIAEQANRKVDETHQHVSDEFAVVRGLIEAVGTEAENAKDIAGEAAAVAKGRATGYVFNTVDDMDVWLNNPDNTAQLVLGDNLYVREVGVPDYWWDGVSRQQLETQKVDLAEYVKNNQVLTKDKAGLCFVPDFMGGWWGIKAANQETCPGGIVIKCADQSDIDNRRDGKETRWYRPIVPAHLDYAVKCAIANNTYTMAQAEKKNACKWIGTLNVVENADGSITVTFPSGKTKTVDLSKIEIFL